MRAPPLGDGLLEELDVRRRHGCSLAGVEIEPPDRTVAFSGDPQAVDATVLSSFHEDAPSRTLADPFAHPCLRNL
jgi:hypothetical protein